MKEPEQIKPTSGAVPKIAPASRRFGAYAAIGLLTLIVLSGTFWMRIRDRFVVNPKALGSYSGAIKFTDGTQVPMLLEVEDQSLSVIALVRNSTMVERLRSNNDSLVLQVDSVTVTLRGQLNDYGEFVGTASTSDERRGQFVFGARNEPRALSTESHTESKSWVALQAERTTLDEKLAKTAVIAEGKLAEIERLKNFVNDKGRLRAGADNKYAQVAAQLGMARDELAARKERAQKLAASLALAQRVTPLGRLVTLARESNDRELRWIESMLRSGDRVGPVGIEEDVQLGMEILKLKEEIARERDRVVALGGDPDV